MIFGRIGKDHHTECTFCYMDMVVGDKVTQLACHESHQFHNECYENFITHFE